MFAAKCDGNNAATADPGDRTEVENGEAGPEPSLPPGVVERLGAELRAFYGHLLNEPVPERLSQLLEQLDRKERSDHGK